MGNLAQYYIPATAAIGTAMYGIDTGIIATTIGHQSFNDHMFPPDGEDAALIGKPSMLFTQTLTMINKTNKNIAYLQVPLFPSTMPARLLAPSSRAGPPINSAADTPLQLRVLLPLWVSCCP